MALVEIIIIIIIIIICKYDLPGTDLKMRNKGMDNNTLEYNS
jgi:hypothetical protein